MTDDERADELGSLFVSVTGDTSVAESQEDDADTRELTEDVDEESADPIAHHGLGDAIDDPDVAENPV